MLKCFGISQFTLFFLSLTFHLTKARYVLSDLIWGTIIYQAPGLSPGFSPSLLTFAKQRAAQTSCPETALGSHEAAQAEGTNWSWSFADGWCSLGYSGSRDGPVLALQDIWKDTWKRVQVHLYAVTLQKGCASCPLTSEVTLQSCPRLFYSQLQFAVSYC